MQRYFISHQEQLKKKINDMLYDKIKEKGEFIISEWNGDYLVNTYFFDNKIYELLDNMELGVRSEIREYSVKEYINETKKD